MARIDNLCMGCMKDSGEERTCPLCGYREGTPQLPPLLPVKSMLENRYIVGKAIGVNGEGVSYIGYDLNTNVIVTVKEFFPENLSGRAPDSHLIKPIAGCETAYKEHLESFRNHAKSLARIREIAAISPLYDIFEGNGTAYTVSEWVDGVSLQEYLAANGGNISWEQARVFFMPVLNALTALHDAGLMHLGISPRNLIIAKDGKMKLVGFGIAAVRMSRTDLQPELNAGYAAFEQYGYEGSQGMWTDIYGFCASLYTALTGKALPAANARSIHDKIALPANVVLPPHVVKALEKGLEVSPDDRIRTFEQLRAELSAAPTASTMTNTATFVAAPQNGKKEKKKNGFSYMLMAMGGVMLVLIIIIILIVVFVFPDLLPWKKGDGSNLTQNYVPPVVSSREPVSQPAITADYNVPKLIGKGYDGVITNEAYSRFKIVIGSYEFDNSVEEGYIKAQNPQENAPINKGDTITVTLSLGPLMRELPRNLKNRPLNDVLLELYEKGFKKGTITERYDPNVEAGLVLDTEQSSGSKYEYGTRINIFVSGLKGAVGTGDDNSGYPDE